MISIDKVDSQIVKLVMERTAKDYVHNKDKPIIDKEGRHKREGGKWSLEDLEREIQRLNELFETEGVDIYLVAVEKLGSKSLNIKVFEKSTKKLIRILGEDEMEKILKKIMGNSGIIFDRMV
jgi:uncharacterized FlaG/YvyC family protein